MKFKWEICCGGHISVTYGGELLYLQMFFVAKPAKKCLLSVCCRSRLDLITHAFQIITPENTRPQYSMRRSSRMIAPSSEVQ